MEKIRILTIAMLGGMLLHGEATTPIVTINLDYDSRVPATTVFRATRQASHFFVKIGTPVQFRNSRTNQKTSAGLQLDMYIAMEAPAGMNSAALGLSYPFRQDGRIEVFYSRIQEYKPVECRDVVLAYILTHEITHALEGMQRHTPTGVMKEKWDREDFKRIQAGKLEFDPMDVESIREGIEKRMNTAALLTSMLR
jgi:hypothetical protein